MKNCFVISLIFLIALIGACSTEKVEEIKERSSWSDGVVYEIFVQSFADSNRDGIGDFNGMTKKLDYLESLGIEAVWLMPMMPSPSYHKYDVTDYTTVHPDYGTMEEFKTFVSQAHEHDIKVIIDFVINHTSSQHPWFISAAAAENSPYRDYYVWADKDSVVQQIAKKSITMDSDNIRQWHPVDGDTTAPHYYGFFYGGMPDLNFDNPDVLEKITKIGRFWLEDIGVDGFRLDAAKHIFPDDRAEDNHRFWMHFKQEMQQINPNVYLVGEVWDDAETVAPYTRGFSALFNFDLSFSILESIKRQKNVSSFISGHGWEVADSVSLVVALMKNRQLFKNTNSSYKDAIFLSNHDQNRIMSVLDGNVDKAKLAASILLTLPGTPYLYYGEEIGMKGMKPDENIREPFLWEAQSDTARTTWMTPTFTTNATVHSLSTQISDENSLYNHYKHLIELRNKNLSLSQGEIEIIVLKKKEIISYSRVYQGERFLIFHNVSEQAITFPLEKSIGKTVVLYTNGEISLSTDSLSIDPLGSVVLQEIK